ncbi:hypothetical protein PGTUg99_031363 [Puccinia graminis f. sp. tritici]|uniref:Trehalose 6-phosphate phosphatase n=2 Tax=Puccinia graminis f. sp. tritici TaxID=56615 RepID=A0A5B0QR68_PUCGR|nr:hypothetical protein PGTUg99_031363 [Puccinia graminis f. sp. tritici]
MNSHHWRAAQVALIICCIFGPLSNIGLLVHCIPMEGVLTPLDSNVMTIPSVITPLRTEVTKTPRESKRPAICLEVEENVAKDRVLSGLEPEQKMENGEKKPTEVQITRPPALDHQKTIADFQNAKKKLMYLDFDGTMVKFQSRPHQAVPSEALLEVLDKLEKDLTTEVVIISGRDKDFLQEQFGHYPSFHLSAEYGALWRKPGEAWDQAEGLADKLKWKDNVRGLMDTVVREHNEVFGGRVWVEEKMTGLVLHYRELEESDIASRAQGLKIVNKFFENMRELKKTGQLPDDKLIVENDNCAVEVRMGELFSKGQIAQQVLKDKVDIEMVLCFGDSGSDENMMNTLFQMQKDWPKFPPMLTTVHVDNGKWLQKGFKTNAQQVAKDPQEVTNLFRAFYDLPPKDVNLNFEKKLADANSKHAQKSAEASLKLTQRLADLRLNDGQLLSRIINILKFYLSSLKFVSYLNPK